MFPPPNPNDRHIEYDPLATMWIEMVGGRAVYRYWMLHAALDQLSTHLYDHHRVDL